MRVARVARCGALLALLCCAPSCESLFDSLIERGFDELRGRKLSAEERRRKKAREKKLARERAQIAARVERQNRLDRDASAQFRAHQGRLPWLAPRRNARDRQSSDLSDPVYQRTRRRMEELWRKPGEGRKR